MNIKLNLKVLGQILEDLQNLSHKVVFIQDEKLRDKLIEEVKDLNNSAIKLQTHYTKILKNG